MKSLCEVRIGVLGRGDTSLACEMWLIEAGSHKMIVTTNLLRRLIQGDLRLNFKPLILTVH